MNRFFLYVSSVLMAIALLFTSCKKDDDVDSNNNSTGGGDLSGEVTGTLKKGVYTITSNIIVPVGQTLTLEPGVSLIFDGDGLSPSTSPELRLDGNLVANGTEADPILFSVPENKRTAANHYSGLWGGIQASNSTEYLVMRHCTIEYCGGPADGSRPDLYDEGDARFGIHFSNPSGVFILENSTMRHTADDGIRPQGGGKFAIVNNVFYNIGETGGEAFNFKDGSTGDICYNLFYGIATNGVKPAGPGDGVPQSNIRTYNNTFVNCGFRRVQPGRGGSINFEDGARGNAFNNLIVNCRFGIRFRSDDLPDLANIDYGYTLYYASEATDQDNFFPSTDVDVNGNRLTSQQTGDLIQVDPLFANYDVTTSKLQNLVNSSDDFKLKSNSPAMGVGNTSFSPLNSSLTGGNVTIMVPSPSNFIGAYGSN